METYTHNLQIFLFDKKGNVAWKFNSQLNTEGHISKAIEVLKELN